MENEIQAALAGLRGSMKELKARAKAEEALAAALGVIGNVKDLNKQREDLKEKIAGLQAQKADFENEVQGAARRRDAALDAAQKAETEFAAFDAKLRGEYEKAQHEAEAEHRKRTTALDLTLEAAQAATARQREALQGDIDKLEAERASLREMLSAAVG